MGEPTVTATQADRTTPAGAGFAASMPPPARLRRPPTVREIRRRFPGQKLAWKSYADGWLDFPLGRFLDYGAGIGKFITLVQDRCDEIWACDVDAQQLQQAAEIPGVRTVAIEPGAALPFEDATFDTIAMLEVIEHVGAERPVLAELARVLKPGGHLLLTTPHKGLLTWLDPANFKFIAPGLHRFIYRDLLRQRDYHEERFGTGGAQRSKQMIGDIVWSEDAWHRHYRYQDIRRMAPPELATVGWATYYPGMRAMWCVYNALRILTRRRIRELPAPLRWLDCRLSWVESPTGDQLLILFRKQP